MKKGFFQTLCILTIALISPVLFANEIKSVEFFQKGEISHLEIILEEEAIADRFHLVEDKQVILDLKDVSASKRVLRGIDTSEFSGSVVYISGYQKPGSSADIRYAIQLRDNVRSKMIQKGNKVTLQLENRFGAFTRPDAEKKSKESHITKTAKGVVESAPGDEYVDDVETILTNLTSSGKKKFIGRKISLNVQNMKMNELLKIIAETSGFNIIIDNEVYEVAPVTLSLNDIPWDQVLNIVLDLGKLVAKKHDNILQVSTLQKLREEQKQELDSQETTTRLEPLVTKMFPISFASLSDIQEILSEYLSPERGKITRDERTNTLIVKDTIEVMERLKRIIEVLDTQTPQILIESKIVEANESYSKRLGLSRGLSFGYDPVSEPGDPVGPGFTFSTAPTPSMSDTLGFSIGVFRRLQNLDLNLQLMESESKGRVVSSPKVITQNKQEAKLISTETTSFRVMGMQGAMMGGAMGGAGAVGGGMAGGAMGGGAMGGGAMGGGAMGGMGGGAMGGMGGALPGMAGFQQVDATLELSVTPHVTNEGSIAMKVDIQKEGFGSRPFPDAPPDTTSRQVSTNVLVDNGSTVVIGGLYTSTTSEEISGVPVLKDIPLIGWFFRSAYNPDSSRSELIIFLTPRIINQEEAGLVKRTNPVGG